MKKQKILSFFSIQHFARLLIYLSKIENSKFVEFLVFELSGTNVFLHYNRRHQISHPACQQLANTYGDVIITRTAAVTRSLNANRTSEAK